VTRAAPSCPAVCTDFSGVRPTDTPLLGGVLGVAVGRSAGGVIPGGRVNVVLPLFSARALTLLLLLSDPGASSRPLDASTALAPAGVMLLSAGTVARPTAVRFAAALPSASPSSTGFAEAPAAPDIACVSVMH